MKATQHRNATQHEMEISETIETLFLPEPRALARAVYQHQLNSKK